MLCMSQTERTLDSRVLEIMMQQYEGGGNKGMGVVQGVCRHLGSFWGQ